MREYRDPISLREVGFCGFVGCHIDTQRRFYYARSTKKQILVTSVFQPVSKATQGGIS